MNKLKTIPVLSFLIGAILAGTAMAGFFRLKNPAGENRSFYFSEEKTAPLSNGTSGRANITFILGEEEGGKNSYYASAADFYRLHPTEGTELVVTHCRSLLAVLEHLSVHRPADGLPWGRINLVVHGNEWSGLAVPVLPNGRRTTSASLQEAIDSGAFQSLPDHIVDACTEIRIEGCGVGRDTELLAAFKKGFGGDGEQPQMLASPYFIYFSSSKNAGQPRRELLEPFYTFYPKSYRPADSVLAERLQKTYPAAVLNWQAALSSETPGAPGVTYSHEFDVPIVWVVAYPEGQSLPELTAWKDQKKWLDEQTELKDVLKAYDMPRDNFQWTFLPQKLRLEDGREVPAIRAIGLCTVLTVLRPVENSTPRVGLAVVN